MQVCVCVVQVGELLCPRAERETVQDERQSAVFTQHRARPRVVTPRTRQHRRLWDCPQPKAVSASYP